MVKKRYDKSLSVQLLIGILFSLLIALASFWICYYVGNVLIDKAVYSEKAVSIVSDRKFKRLQAYVKDENITLNNLQRLNAWTSSEKGVYIVIYNNGNAVYDSSYVKNDSAEKNDRDFFEENIEHKYELEFNDGNKAQVFLYYYASDAFYYLVIVVSGLLAFIVFSLCFISLVNRKLLYIKKLKKELDILAGGNLEYKVTTNGDDELGELAMGIDEMRKSILNHQRSEEEMRSANSQLVTAMSHDLRTPLTSLLAFLEILDRDKVVDDNQRKHLINQCLKKTMNIKAMADKLFEYFLVYTAEWEDPNLQIHDADEVLLHFWQEYAFALENQGFIVNTSFETIKGNINANIDLLSRAFDNLYANLIKYADNNFPIDICYVRNNDSVALSISNKIAKQKDQIESNNIGLNTCDRIIRMHGGLFDMKKHDDSFVVNIRLPLIQK